ncbi:hypothetical protein EVAR_39505_1 [Eumeta japonica]|uniref:Uncharacterized protein n=1 Tax=Eumeta variegata TaxID=151549 RepID=A0A4C1W2S1_EUMVA|nr:hypothetical protein EVAR_39505_1 [Eumeta japonica]
MLTGFRKTCAPLSYNRSRDLRSECADVTGRMRVHRLWGGRGGRARFCGCRAPRRKVVKLNRLQAAAAPDGVRGPPRRAPVCVKCIQGYSK